ncbi:MAG: adenosylcobinamide-GDP ribazoletransferase [Peptococcaceae bacterium]|nr:adenosylcobinamide-GDP ribazoletransferase [Peptococcaceae bacterium]
MRGLITALRTLTAIPVPGRDARLLADALPYFPVVGALLGLLVSLGGWGLLAAAPEWTAGAAALMLLLEILLTGGLHTDGLGDAADALGAGGDRRRALAIMKDSRQGSFGVVAIVLVLLFKWAAYLRLLELVGGWKLVCLAFAVSRQATAHLAAFQTYARAGGGTGQPFVGARRVLPIIVGWLIVAGGLLVTARPAAAAIILAAGLAWLFGRWCRARYGGVTGDLLGAHTEISLVAVLFLLVILT